MALRGDTSGHLKKMWIFFTLTLVCCIFPSPSNAQETLQTLLTEVQGGKEIRCYVCSSVDGECDTDDNGKLPEDYIKECKGIAGGDSYLETVYGSKALSDTGKDLKMWPQSLTELAKGAGASTAPAPAPPPPSPPSSNNGSKNGSSSSESGWVYATFPGAYLEREPSAASEKLTVSGLSLGRLESSAVFGGGFKSCRVMRIWTDSQKNDGKTQEIPFSKPRIVRTCSFVPHNKGGDNFKDGCRTINFKTATISVCYCDGKTVPCNASSRLQVPTILAFLAVSLLYLFGTL